MKAAVRRKGQLLVADVANPLPRQGEVLVRTLCCGICGSDLHMHHHCETALPLLKRACPAMAAFDPSDDVIFGHEFCAEVVDYGPDTEKVFSPGTRICALPVAVTPDGVATTGYHPRFSGGYGEYMALQLPTLVAVPDELPTSLAALTEPLAVAIHAVNKASMSGGEAALVVGCGPIGLAVIIALKARGIGPVIAADFSPQRRQLAEKLGADVVVDPATKSPYQSWYEAAAPADYDPHGVKALLGIGPQPKSCVIFECVGAQGILNQIMVSAPLRTRIVVVGVCMQSDAIEPLIGISKELSLQFSNAYTMEEFRTTLYMLGARTLVADALITGVISVDEVPAVFGQLRASPDQAKVLIDFTK